MASEAYKRLMKRIPLEVQQRVNFNMEVAHEVHQTLKSQGLTHADLAKRLGKYESEISKWLTGTHNFTLKTIQKIDAALGISILMTKSAKIEEYETQIKELKEKCTELELERDSLESYKKIEVIVQQLYTNQDYFTFNLGARDRLKLKPFDTSDYSVEQRYVTN